MSGMPEPYSQTKVKHQEPTELDVVSLQHRISLNDRKLSADTKPRGFPKGILGALERGSPIAYGSSLPRTRSGLIPTSAKAATHTVLKLSLTVGRWKAKGSL